MSNLILNSLEIEGYRAYRHLVIPQLGRVNLIAGKNNVGKSSLLEAVWLYAKRFDLPELRGVLKTRDELPDSLRPGDKAGERVWDIKNLFYGRQDLRNHLRDLRIGPIEKPEDTLSVSIGWYVSSRDEERRLQRIRVADANAHPEARAYLEVSLGSKKLSIHMLDNLIERLPFSRNIEKTIAAHFIPANGLNNDSLTRLWDGIALTEWEESVVTSLNIIAPEVKRLSFVGKEDDDRRRVPLVKIEGQAEPIYLRSLGEGMNRLLGIILSLVNSRNGILLIDEVESGLHYTVQLNIWRLIFETARMLNVQVFATTHSWDSIEAFQQAALEDQAEEGLLIRLENKLGQITPTLFNEQRLSIATREQIEVR